MAHDGIDCHLVAGVARDGLEAAKTGLKEPIRLWRILPRLMTLELFEEVANGVVL